MFYTRRSPLRALLVATLSMPGGSGSSVPNYTIGSEARMSSPTQGCRLYSYPPVAQAFAAGKFPPLWAPASVMPYDADAMAKLQSIQSLNPDIRPNLPPSDSDYTCPAFDLNYWWRCNTCRAPEHPGLASAQVIAPEEDQQHDEHSLFFIGSNIAGWPLEAQRSLAGAQEICVHTWSRHHLTSLPNEQVFAELYYTMEIVKLVVGTTPACWRPSFGDDDVRIRAIANALGLTYMPSDPQTTERTATTLSPKELKRQKFEKVFARLRDDLMDHMKAENMPPEAVEWYRRNLEFNVPGGKYNRGMSVVDSVEILQGRALTADEYFKSALLGWCIELLQASFLVPDDIMDKSITRRGQPCWYRVEGVGNIAINDAVMLDGAIYHLLKKYFRDEIYYGHLLELFHETTLQTAMGQLVDLITAPEDRVNLSSFSFAKHAFIVQYKTAYYSFYLSVALAMRFCGIPERYEVNGQQVEPYAVALSILLRLGEYFQVQDDFLDYAGTPEQIGKIGTDIIDNKCSWPINVALSVATPEQRAVLDANYGRKDSEKEAKVKEVYEAIGLAARYHAYEESVKVRIEELIAQVPEPEGGTEGMVLRRDVFTVFLNKIYKRTK